jgi:hypothetical protein
LLQKGPAKKPAGKKTGLDISISDASGAYDWIDVREKVLDAISKIVQLNIQKLWDPPIAEEQFVM